MRKFKSLSQYAEAVAETDATPSISDSEKMMQLQNGLNDLIEKSIADLKQRLLVKGVKAGGVMNTLKRWWSNFWYGSTGTKNPYYYHNVLGPSLGAPSNIDVKRESFSLTLEEFKFLQEQSNLLEANLVSAQTPENTRLFSIINDWEKNFKLALNKFLTSCMLGGSCTVRPTVSPKIPSPIVPAPITEPTGPSAIDMPCEDPRIAHLPPAKKIKKLIDEILTNGDKASEYARKIKKIVPKKDPQEVVEELCDVLDQLIKYKTTVEDDPDWVADHVNRFNALKAITNESLSLKQSLSEYKISKPKISFEKDSTLYEKTLTCLEQLRS